MSSQATKPLPKATEGMHQAHAELGLDSPPLPAPQTHSFVSQTELSAQIYYLLLDLDTCLTPGNGADLNYSL